MSINNYFFFYNKRLKLIQKDKSIIFKKNYGLFKFKKFIYKKIKLRKTNLQDQIGSFMYYKIFYLYY